MIFTDSAWAGVTVAYQFVFRSGGCTAGVARRGADHALHVLEDGLNAPEAATGDNGGFAQSWPSRAWRLQRGSGLVALGRSPALQAPTPARVTISSLNCSAGRSSEITFPGIAPRRTAELNVESTILCPTSPAETRLAASPLAPPVL